MYCSIGSQTNPIKKTKVMKVKTFLPVFDGFYNTFFECDSEEMLIQDYNIENNTNYDYSDFNWNYEKYYNDTAKQCCSVIENLLKEAKIIKSIEFEKIVSPKYYNYSNDSINITVDIYVNNIKKFLNENFDAFESYVKSKYTSCSGFTSFYSNDPHVWIKDLKSKKIFENNHQIGAILDFICNTIIDSENPSYWLSEKIDMCLPTMELSID